jgi:hypothetical protein
VVLGVAAVVMLLLVVGLGWVELLLLGMAAQSPLALQQGEGCDHTKLPGDSVPML